MLFTGTAEGTGKTKEFTNLDADWGAGFIRSSQHFVNLADLGGQPADMSPESATKVLQLCFAVYQASSD